MANIAMDESDIKINILFWGRLFTNDPKYIYIKFPCGCCPRDYHWSMKSNRAVTVIYSVSECCLSGDECKTWTELSAGTLANGADPDQTPQDAMSPMRVCTVCFNYSKLRVKWIRSPRSGPFSQPKLRDYRLTSAFSALFLFCFSLIPR